MQDHIFELLTLTKKIHFYSQNIKLEIPTPAVDTRLYNTVAEACDILYVSEILAGPFITSSKLIGQC